MKHNANNQAMTEKTEKSKSSNVLTIKERSSKQAAKDDVKKINFEQRLDGKWPHVYGDENNPKKQATIANLKHLFKSYGITVNYDELLKKQTVTCNNSRDQ